MANNRRKFIVVPIRKLVWNAGFYYIMSVFFKKLRKSNACMESKYKKFSTKVRSILKYRDDSTI